ncbi:hypothetical protein KIN20_005380 [Parelaphostrongylus tenuis]|uniref:Uncharacterized protein n=1 Tax=Parelaphostrongylus tenuis TaxID=148309 RepID=A0AAD5M093_PARTN|nr:hypothetical protein KIN20_005380 [Parelaphostrongylus tenuis]
MVTPIFFGRNCQEMSMMFNIHVKHGGRWLNIPEDLLCIYDLNSSNNIDEVEKLQQQLLFKDQANLRFVGYMQSSVDTVEPDGANWQISSSAELVVEITICNFIYGLTFIIA